jgi:GntR family transcriptional regulator
MSIARQFRREDLAKASMLTLLEQAGAPAQEAEQWITAVAAEATIAAALDVSLGDPLLKIERVMRGPRRKPVHYIEVHYRPDRYHYHFRAQKNGRSEGWLDQ